MPLRNIWFFTKARPLFGEEGGIADALVGSALIVAMAMIMAIPVSVLVAIYISEYAGPRLGRALKVVLGGEQREIVPASTA